MKKNNFMLVIATSLTLSSCVNDSEYLFEKPTVQHARVYHSFDEMFSQDSQHFIGWESSSTTKNNEPIALSSVNTITLNGYSSKMATQAQKTILGSTLCKLIGIANQIYVVEYVTAYQDITIQGLGTTTFFSTVDSPLCGMDPNNSDYRRGYSSSTPDANGGIRLATKCIHIISDLSGRSYNMWYPCKPEEVQWKYNLINM